MYVQEIIITSHVLAFNVNKNVWMQLIVLPASVRVALASARRSTRGFRGRSYKPQTTRTKLEAKITTKIINPKIYSDYLIYNTMKMSLINTLTIKLILLKNKTTQRHNKHLTTWIILTTELLLQKLNNNNKIYIHLIPIYIFIDTKNSSPKLTMLHNVPSNAFRRVKDEDYQKMLKATIKTAKHCFRFEKYKCRTGKSRNKNNNKK